MQGPDAQQARLQRVTTQALTGAEGVEHAHDLAEGGIADRGIDQVACTQASKRQDSRALRAELVVKRLAVKCCHQPQVVHQTALCVRRLAIHPPQPTASTPALRTGHALHGAVRVAVSHLGHAQADCAGVRVGVRMVGSWRMASPLGGSNGRHGHGMQRLAPTLPTAPDQTRIHPARCPRSDSLVIKLYATDIMAPIIDTHRLLSMLGTCRSCTRRQCEHAWAPLIMPAAWPAAACHLHCVPCSLHGFRPRIIWCRMSLLCCSPGCCTHLAQEDLDAAKNDLQMASPGSKGGIVSACTGACLQSACRRLATRVSQLETVKEAGCANLGSSHLRPSALTMKIVREGWLHWSSGVPWIWQARAAMFIMHVPPVMLQWRSRRKASEQK